MCCIFRPLASMFLIVLLHLMNVPSCHRCPVPGTTLPPPPSPSQLSTIYVNKTRFRLALRFRWRQRPTACLFLCMFLYLLAPTPPLFAISPSLFRLIYESLNVASRVASRCVAWKSELAARRLARLQLVALINIYCMVYLLTDGIYLQIYVYIFTIYIVVGWLCHILKRDWESELLALFRLKEFQLFWP